jgi:GTP-binding protein HflX
VSDTVGFIRELPHQLVAAFRATLEETIHADLLLHVVDASSAVRLDQIDQVNEVLHEIGADTVRQILVFNKIDAVPELAARGEAVERDEYGNISRVFLSARTGQGLDALRAAIAEIATSDNLSAWPDLSDAPDAHDVSASPDEDLPEQDQTSRPHEDLDDPPLSGARKDWH